MAGRNKQRCPAKFPLPATVTLDAVSPDSAVVMATGEQAVYLARNYANMTEGKVVTSESIDGISVGYTLVGTGSANGVCFRAAQFISQAKRMFSAGTVRISRG